MDPVAPQPSMAQPMVQPNPAPPGTPRGSPAARETWEQQYRSGGWDYLGGEDEAAHYRALAQLCDRHLRGASLLDIGCGTGILVAWLQRHAGMALPCYTGIDLAGEAVRQAQASWPGARFSRLDYSTDPVPGRYDGVIFNETLYCFADPLAILKKSIADNLHPGALLLVSMYGEHHQAIWDAVAAHCATVDELVVENSCAVRWKIRALRPLAASSAARGGARMASL